MKTVCILLLMMVVLSGCTQTNGAEETVPQTLEIVYENGTVENASDWTTFLHNRIGMNCSEEVCWDKESIILLSFRDKNEQAVLRYDDGFYQIEDSYGLRLYNGLVYDIWESENEIREFYFLSNDPDMTAQKFAEGNAVEELQAGQYCRHLDAQIVYLDTIPVQREEEYGQPPEWVARLLDQNLLDRGVCCGESIFCGKEYYAQDATGWNHYLGMTYQRYTYSGELLITFQTRQRHDWIYELPDDGFLMGFGDTLCAFHEDGSVRWEYVYPHENGSSAYGEGALLVGETIYTFGTVEEKTKDGDYGYRDLIVSKFTYDGTLLQERTYGGSDFEWFYHVEQQEDGFLLYGSTQSGDGEFPLSMDGYGVGFCVEVDMDLQLGEVRVVDYRKQSAGILPALDSMSREEQIGYFSTIQFAEAAFRMDEGYVVVSRHRLADSKIWNGGLMGFTEQIITGYSQEGEPLWQVTSDVMDY